MKVSEEILVAWIELLRWLLDREMLDEGSNLA